MTNKLSVMLTFFLSSLFMPELSSADFFADVSVSVTPIGQNFKYEYTISNNPISDVSVYVWLLFVNPMVDSTEFVNPPEWRETYLPGESEILWKCESPFDVDPAFVILPGSTGHFSFFSPLGPGPTTYEISGLGLEGDDPILTGSTLGPVQVIPEPGTITLLCIGTVTIIASRGCSLRQWFRDSLANVKPADSCS